MHWAHPKLSRPTNSAPRAEISARVIANGPHPPCVRACDKATHLHVTWSLFLLTSSLLLPRPTIPTFVTLIQYALLPQLRAGAVAARMQMLKLRKNSEIRLPLPITLRYFNSLWQPSVRQLPQRFWWCSVSHTSFSLSHSICQSACHSSVAPLSIKAVSQLVPKPSFGLPVCQPPI